MKIAVIGVTGQVGRTILEVLQESRLFFETELVPVASSRSYGEKVVFSGEEYKVISMGEALEANPDIAIFSAGAE
ncbi:MAG: aspartate-semialdehyde dehydrogenase, partial [Bacteroidetes bacterium]|nr:aspartate-semialdehyde dehydrogenase [Bacteroidota bacterium]